MPTIMRKASARTLIDGWRSTNSPIGLAATSITPTENTTAVITESSENTIPMTAI